jgi:hypothetical protein
MCQQNFAGAGLLLARLKIKMRQQTFTLFFMIATKISVQ